MNKELMFGLAMALLGYIVGWYKAQGRVTKFLNRINTQLQEANPENPTKIKIDPWYRFRSTFFGLPKEKKQKG